MTAQDRLEEVHQALEEVRGLEEEQDEFHWEPEQESLWNRLFLLLADDAVAHALVFVASMIFFLDIHLPSTLLMVLLPAFVGALLVLDYCGQVKEEVSRVWQLSRDVGPLCESKPRRTRSDLAGLIGLCPGCMRHRSPRLRSKQGWKILR